uniref:RNA polymerase alpha subunit n=1 Tax=Parallela transversalis TaxID=163324 RepID=UPI0010C4B38E|nr:RNA polymerase alpha subunit [Parallela transversalis]AYQ22912.1 RNA polymerase alpha subunit [Parallela transversalis]
MKIFHHMNKANNLSKPRFFLTCKESRVENSKSLYGSFYLGPFQPGQSLTIANALRRTLLSELTGIAITGVQIEGALHEYSTLPGLRDSVLDIILNLKEVTLKKTDLSTTSLTSATQAKINTSYEESIENFNKFNEKKIYPSEEESQIRTRFTRQKKDLLTNPQIGYLKARGPGILRARDLKLPPSIQSVNPDQYLFTLCNDGIFHMKFWIHQGKNAILKSEGKRNFLEKKVVNLPKFSTRVNKISLLEQKDFSAMEKSKKSEKYILASSSTRLKNKSQNNKLFTNSNFIAIDAIFTPITQVNYIIEEDYFFNHTIFIEIRTNGSLSPRKALFDGIQKLVNLFSRLEKLRILESNIVETSYNSLPTWCQSTNKFSVN